MGNFNVVFRRNAYTAIKASLQGLRQCPRRTNHLVESAVVLIHCQRKKYIYNASEASGGVERTRSPEMTCNLRCLSTNAAAKSNWANSTLLPNLTHPTEAKKDVQIGMNTWGLLQLDYTRALKWVKRNDTVNIDYADFSFHRKCYLIDECVPKRNICVSSCSLRHTERSWSVSTSAGRYSKISPLSSKLRV